MTMYMANDKSQLKRVLCQKTLASDRTEEAQSRANNHASFRTSTWVPRTTARALSRYAFSLIWYAAKRLLYNCVTAILIFKQPLNYSSLRDQTSTAI